MNQHQDWTPKVLSKKPTSPKKQIDNSNKKNDDTEPENTQIKVFDKKFGQLIATLRAQKSLTQKALAAQLNMQESIIKNLEQGTEKYNGQIVHKLKAFFGSDKF
jgi:ribosome-binding protein aMBF1 (putative translation factor)